MRFLLITLSRSMTLSSPTTLKTSSVSAAPVPPVTVIFFGLTRFTCLMTASSVSAWVQGVGALAETLVSFGFMATCLPVKSGERSPGA
jgi:hypothetical protein